MPKNIFSKLFKKPSFWKFASFSEIGELYIARLMRTIGINVGAAFMSVYMLKNGYSIVYVSLFWGAYFGFKAMISLPMSQLVANIGAKKAISISNILYVPAIIGFMLLPDIGVWALVISGLLQSISATMYDIGYMVGFSRAKSDSEPGRQVAIMSVMDKIAKGISPLIGGLLAMFFDPRISMMVSTMFFILASWSLMRTSDSMTIGFNIKPKSFPWRMARPSLLAQLPVGFDYYASNGAWSIFLASLIFTASGNQVYAEMGALTSLILIVSIVATHAYGKLIDRKAGGYLLVYAAIAEVFVNILRAFTRTPVMALGTNAANEVAITGYNIAFTRGVFDIADRSGYRVMYIGMSQMSSYLGATIAAIALAFVVSLLDTIGGFTVFYLLVAAVVSTMTLARFRVYGRTQA